MGKRIISQRRGRGSARYRAPGFRFQGAAKHPKKGEETKVGRVLDIVHCRAHTVPLVKVEFEVVLEEGGENNNLFEKKETCLMLAPEGIRVGDTVTTGKGAEVKNGNTLKLKDIPEGTLVYNIESVPGDGGKFVRASGGFARIVAKTPSGVVVRLPSKRQKIFKELCRASIGVLAGGGRLEKPILKAGIAHYKAKARNHLYPSVSGSAMNAVDHPFGNKRTSRKSKARPTSGNAPPGRKVGMVAARRTGRKKK